MALSFILTIAMLGIPFYGHGSSAVVIGIIVIALLWLYLNPKTQAGLKEKFRVSARTLNTALLCTMMIVIGYSSYALIVIRSTANTPMTRTHRKTSSPWANTWDVSSTAHARCSTHRRSRHKWRST